MSLSVELARLEAEGRGLQAGRVPDGALGVAHSTQVTLDPSGDVQTARQLLLDV